MDMGESSATPTDDIPDAQPTGVTRMGDLIMPPGMVMGAEMSMAAMADTAAVDTTSVTATAPPSMRGDQLLAPELVDGAKEYRLRTSVVRWMIAPDVWAFAYAYNAQVPGPRLTLTVGDPVRVVVTNDLREPTTVHWHGLDIPNEMDGQADIVQRPIPPGSSFTYEFTPDTAGTFFYHSHTAADRQQALGLYGALIVQPANPDPVKADQDVVNQLQEWTIRDGYTFPAMPMEGLLPNFFTINGKSWPLSQTVKAKVGERIRFRFIGAGSFAHPMHIHGGPFTVVATDGHPVPTAAQLTKDTVNVAPGERYDVVWTARRPGKWLLHCHINHHLTNDGAEVGRAGGLSMVIDVAA